MVSRTLAPGVRAWAGPVSRSAPSVPTVASANTVRLIIGLEFSTIPLMQFDPLTIIVLQLMLRVHFAPAGILLAECAWRVIL